MIIWASVGLLGFIGGMVSVGVARRHNHPAETATETRQCCTVVAPVTKNAPAAEETPLSADSLTQAA
ncbi:hypothetical protein [Arthrobacter sp. ZGTC212]|uniref:hypothetical protein n=1 Tax=Arthrobacter sp. ZGTC212 TaxID=2058899 RepID=UPI0011B0EC90|nr:hypothetical protein [Arthrobacter sp. ZGTC212]